MAKTEFIRARVDEGLPFDIKIPNAVTRKVLDDAEIGVGVHKCDNLDETLREMELNAD